MLLLRSTGSAVHDTGCTLDHNVILSCKREGSGASCQRIALASFPGSALRMTFDPPERESLVLNDIKAKEKVERTQFRPFRRAHALSCFYAFSIYVEQSLRIRRNSEVYVKTFHLDFLSQDSKGAPFCFGVTMPTTKIFFNTAFPREDADQRRFDRDSWTGVWFTSKHFCGSRLS